MFINILQKIQNVLFEIRTKITFFKWLELLTTLIVYINRSLTNPSEKEESYCCSQNNSQNKPNVVSHDNKH